MSTLIIGGLLLIGIAALVALFFVLRSSDTARIKPAEAAPQTAKDALPTPTFEQGQQPVLTQQAGEAIPTVETRTVPVTNIDDHHTTFEKEQPLDVRLNGRFHELALGLRSLQQQAIEMEQRLDALNQMLDTVKYNPQEEE
jgi:hypothetical protein